jgi:Flp pilus assembly protein protease CpaA
MKIANKISVYGIFISLFLILFFGMGLDNEGNTCLIIDAILCIPFAVSTITYNLTQQERRG